MFYFYLLSVITLFGSCIRAYPAQASLASLNLTVQGRLYAATPLARPCYSTFEGRSVQTHPSQCSELQAHYTSGAYRTEFYSGFMHDQSETCASSSDPINSQCLLDPMNPTLLGALSNASCGQGSVSDYYVEISSAADIKAAFAFARQTGTSLSVKNSGHDYGSRSSLRGSLALWTRKLQKQEYHPNFIAEGCPEYAARQKALTFGAGANFDQAYRFADQNNVTYVGGSSPTVGAAGGWVMTGGHGLLSAQYGLGIDRVLQYKIVTPDGVLRTANSCQNQDLFWALRGGGGGTFGVVMEITSKVEAGTPLVFAEIALPATSTNTTQFTQIMMKNAIKWSKEGWGGPNGPSFIAMVNPFIDLAAANKSMAEISSYALSQGGTVILETHSSFLSIYEKYVAPTGDTGNGYADFPTNRLIPTSFLQTTQGQANILTYLNKLSAAGFTPTIFATVPAYANAEYVPESTSATPAWRDSTWMITTSTEWVWNSTVAEKKETVRKLKGITAELETLAPNSGSYISEADPWTPDWQRSWWGKNYAKLEEIKRKYDPQGLLSCWRCVGWDQALEKPGKAFECMGGLDV